MATSKEAGEKRNPIPLSEILADPQKVFSHFYLSFEEGGTHAFGGDPWIQLSPALGEGRSFDDLDEIKRQLDALARTKEGISTLQEALNGEPIQAMIKSEIKRRRFFNEVHEEDFLEDMLDMYQRGQEIGVYVGARPHSEYGMMGIISYPEGGKRIILKKQPHPATDQA